MARRVLVATAIAVVVALLVAGCQATGPGAFTRSDAQADVARWTAQAEDAISDPAPTAQPTLNAFDVCRSDQGYFATTYQWRTVTTIDVPAARQAGAIRAIETAFTGHQWRATVSRGIVALTGPRSAKRRGFITLQTDGASQLSIAVISPCYD
jgi:hypothetical protein